MFVPGDRSKVLFPIVFCRECGQEYYTAWSESDPETGGTVFTPRPPNDYRDEDEREAFLLHFDTENPWPEDPFDVLDRLPDDWIEETTQGRRIRAGRKKWQPTSVWLGPDGKQARRVCVSKRPKLLLGSVLRVGSRTGGEGEGITQSCRPFLPRDEAQPPRFLASPQSTDSGNRPSETRAEASVFHGQSPGCFPAGWPSQRLRGDHRSSIGSPQGRKRSEPEGLRHEELTQKVFEALNLPIEEFARDPGVQFQAKKETERALRESIGYRIYRDLQRGWRVTSPNLEQCGLLRSITFPWTRCVQRKICGHQLTLL